MNQVYRVVFNTVTGAWQAVSEIARGPGKSSRRARRSPRARNMGHATLHAAALAAVLASPATLAATSTVIDSAGLTFDGLQTEIRTDDFSGPGGITKNGTARLFLQGNNSYQGGTTLQEGSLVVGSNSALGLGVLSVAGASTLRSNRPVILGNHIALNAGLSVAGLYDLELSGVLSGTGQLRKTGLGTLTLEGVNTWTGGIDLSGGTLSFNDSGTLGSGALTTSGTATLRNTETVALSNAIAVNGDLTLDTAAALAYGGQLTGSGQLTKTGADELVLSSSNNFNGGWNIAQGTVTALGGLALGAPSSVNLGTGAMLNINGNTSIGALTGSGTTNIGIGSMLSVGANNADSVYSGSLANYGALKKVGSGVLELAGTSNLHGDSQVSAGTLKVTGSLNGGRLTVASAATLTGTGSIGGLVSVANNGHLAGTSGGTFSMGSLTLAPNASVDVALGSPVTGNQPLFSVAGHLTLDGQLNVTNAGGFGDGIYRLFDYGGSLTDNTLIIRSLPGLLTTSDVQLQTVIYGQVNLLVSSPHHLVQFWDGAGLVPNGNIEGGSGVWKSGATNWTSFDGANNENWLDQFAVFQGAAGVVAVEGAQTVNGMQFMTDGYVLNAGAGGELNVVNGNGANFAVRVDPHVTATLNLPLNGSGTLDKLDNGTLVLNGHNGYTGGTLLHGGTLVVGNEHALGSGSLSTANSTTLDSSQAVTLANNIGVTGQLNIAGSSALTLNGAISGSGGLRKNGSATLTLGGNNSFQGPVELNAGTLVLASNTALGSGTLTTTATNTGLLDNSVAMALGNAVVLDGQLTWLGSKNLGLTGSISGNGRLLQQGTSTLTLTGTNTYSGGTTISGGTLVAASSQALGTGDVTVDAGAALEVASGTTLTVGKDLNFQAGATYRVHADPHSSSSSRISVDGTATLAGSVLHVGPQSNAQTDFQVGKTYTILEASQISGKFSEATSNYAYLDAALGYTSTDVTLQLQRKSNGGNTIGFADLASTPNQTSVARGIESLPNSHALYQHIETLPAGTPEAVLASLSGDTHASVAGSLVNLGARAPSISSQHLYSNLTAGLRSGAPVAQSSGTLPASAWPSSKALPAWAEVVGHWQTYNGDGNAARLKQNTAGLFVGMDQEVAGSGWRLGGSLGYTHADGRVADRSSTSKVDSYSAAVYGGKSFGTGSGPRINVLGGLAYTWHDIQTSRNVASLGQTLKSDYSAHTAQLFAEVGYAIGQYDKFGFEPFVGVSLGEQRTRGFHEKGGFAALQGQSSTDNLASTTLGLRVHSDFQIVGKESRLRATVGWRHAFGDVNPQKTMAFEGGQNFTVAGAPLARNTALLGLEAEMALSRSAALVLGLRSELGSGQRDHAANVKLRWAF